MISLADTYETDRCLHRRLAAFAQTPQTPNPNVHYHLGPIRWRRMAFPRRDPRPLHAAQPGLSGHAAPYWVYVPAQYDPAVPASLMIFNDGQAFMAPDGDGRAQNVMDNLIYRREIPVMIGVFINPGPHARTAEPTLAEWGDRTTNRPTEYNSLDDRYARVIVDELMPVLYKEYNISKDPERHGIGGASSGAIAAFTVAWQRPNDFRKVLSIVGSFVNLRGGDAYPDIVRKSEKKPIRVFLQDGRNDNRGVGRGGKYDETRDWFLQNVRLMQALTEKGYDVNYSLGHEQARPEDGRRDYARHDALAVARPRRVGGSQGHGGAVLQRAEESGKISSTARRNLR